MITEIPVEALDQATLRAVIESFINREGTDYGAEEISLEEKMLQIHTQLKSRQAILVFDPESESVNIITADEARRARLVHDERSLYEVDDAVYQDEQDES